MSTYSWSPDLSVGQPDIDDDHREMFRLLHELETADASAVPLSDIIHRLELYSTHHFAREEALMRRFHYPDYDDHIRRHKLFVEWLDAVKHAYDRSLESTFEIAATVNEFLGRWMVEHVLHEDMRYRDHILAQRGGGQAGTEPPK